MNKKYRVKSSKCYHYSIIPISPRFFPVKREAPPRETLYYQRCVEISIKYCVQNERLF